MTFINKTGCIRIQHSQFPNLFLSISNMYDGDLETFPGRFIDETHNDCEWLGDLSRRVTKNNAQSLKKHLEMFEGQMWDYWSLNLEEGVE